MKKQQGLGLVEVMVAALITAIGILGYAGMQVQTLGQTSNAQHRMQALALAGDLLSRVRANGQDDTVKNIYFNANYQAGGHPVSCQTQVCTTTQLASADVSDLRRQLRELLPSAAMRFEKNATNGTYFLTLAWNGQAASADQCLAPVLNENNSFEINCITLEVSV